MQIKLQHYLPRPKPRSEQRFTQCLAWIMLHKPHIPQRHTEVSVHFPFTFLVSKPVITLSEIVSSHDPCVPCDPCATYQQQNSMVHPTFRVSHKVTESTLREIKSVRDTIKAYEDEILNYFISRSTNASAESLNSKLKAFRSQLRGVRDIPFFFYRVSLIFWLVLATDIIG